MKRKVNKKFIEDKLIPFILRENGRGFSMVYWRYREQPGRPLEADALRLVPKCGTVACIGGSIEILINEPGEGVQANKLGLTIEQYDALCYGWKKTNGTTYGGFWPDKFCEAYAKVKTPLAKAKVAIRLLREGIETNGDC